MASCHKLPVHQSSEKEMAEFIFDRQKIWHNRYVLKMPRPWSNNLILNNYKFTEVYRENDRTTKYLINRVIKNENLTEKQKVFAIITFRIFNLEWFFDNYFKEVPSFECFEAGIRIKELDLAKSSGRNLFNNAYNITQRTHIKEFRKGEKHVQHLLNLQDIARDWDRIYGEIYMSESAKQVFDVICSLNFFGPFLSYQCLTDISYIGHLNWQQKFDYNEFVYVGPGAKPGVESVYGEGCDYEKKCKEFFKGQPSIFYKLEKETGKVWHKIADQKAYNAFPYLSLSNIQSCFCEFRKYLAYKNGDSHRVKYYKENKNGLS